MLNALLTARGKLRIPMSCSLLNSRLIHAATHDTMSPTLREYQKTCIDKCLNELALGTRRQIVSLPVGMYPRRKHFLSFLSHSTTHVLGCVGIFFFILGSGKTVSRKFQNGRPDKAVTRQDNEIILSGCHGEFTEKNP